MVSLPPKKTGPITRKSTAANTRGGNTGTRQDPAFLADVGREIESDPEAVKAIAALYAGDGAEDVIDMASQHDEEVHSLLQLDESESLAGGDVTSAPPVRRSADAQPQRPTAPTPRAAPQARQASPQAEEDEVSEAPMPVQVGSMIQNAASLSINRETDPDILDIVDGITGRPSRLDRDREVKVGSQMPVQGVVQPAPAAPSRSTAAARSEPVSLVDQLPDTDNWDDIQPDPEITEEAPAPRPIIQIPVSKPTAPTPPVQSVRQNAARSAARAATGTTVAPPAPPAPSKASTALDAAIMALNVTLESYPQKAKQAPTPPVAAKPAAAPAPVARITPHSGEKSAGPLLSMDCPPNYRTIAKDLYGSTIVDVVSESEMYIGGRRIPIDMATTIATNLNLKIKAR